MVTLFTNAVSGCTRTSLGDVPARIREIAAAATRAEGREGPEAEAPEDVNDPAAGATERKNLHLAARILVIGRVETAQRSRRLQGGPVRNPSPGGLKNRPPDTVAVLRSLQAVRQAEMVMDL